MTLDQTILYLGHGLIDLTIFFLILWLIVNLYSYITKLLGIDLNDGVKILLLFITIAMLAITIGPYLP